MDLQSRASSVESTRRTCSLDAVAEHNARRWVRYFDFEAAGFSYDDFRTALSVFVSSNDAICLDDLHPISEEMTNRMYNNPATEQPDDDGGSSSVLMEHWVRADISLACLRYLNLSDWSSVPKVRCVEREVIQRRNEAHPFYRVATRAWVHIVDMGSVGEPVRSTLRHEIGRLFASARSGNFQSWAFQFAAAMFGEPGLTESQQSSLFINLLQTLAKTASPLHVAACLGLDFVCKVLIEKGFDVDQKSQMGCPLYCAITGPTLLASFFGAWATTQLSICEVSRKNTIKLLVESGALGRQNCHVAQDDAPTWAAIMRRGGCRGPTFGASVLAFAARLRSVDFLRSYLSFPDSCLLDDGFRALLMDLLYPLSYMCVGDITDQDVEEAMAFLNSLYGLLIDRCWRPQYRALWCAAWDKATTYRLPCGQLDCRRPLMLDDEELEEYYKEARNCKMEENWLTSAYYYLVRLVQDGEKPANWLTTDEGQTLLHDAVEEQCEQIIYPLLDRAKGVDISVRDSQGRTPLHFVSGDGPGADPAAMLELLLKHGADLSSADNDGRTVWHYAAANNDLALLKALADVDPNRDSSLRRTTNVGRTPLAEAFAYVSDLKGFPPDPHLRHPESPNPRHMGLVFLLDHCQKDAAYLRSDIPILFYAAEWGSVKVLQRLLECYSSFELSTPDGTTPLHCLNFSASRSFIRLLQSIPGMSELPVLSQSNLTPLEAMFESYNPELWETAHPSNKVRLSVGIFDQLLTDKVQTSIDGKGATLWDRFCRDVIGRYATKTPCDDIIGRLIVAAVCSFVGQGVVQKRNGDIITLTFCLQLADHPTCYWWVTKVFDALTQFIHGRSWQEVWDTCKDGLMASESEDVMVFEEHSSVDFAAFCANQNVMWALRWSRPS